MVLVDVEVALCGDSEFKGAVTCDDIEHVIEEADAGGDFGFAAAVQRQAEAEGGLGGFAEGRGGGPASFFQERRISPRSVFISARVPMVMRTNPGPMSPDRSRRRIPLPSSFAKRAGPFEPKSARRKFPALGKTMAPSLCSAVAKDFLERWILR